MVKIKLLVLGKIKESFLKEGILEYKKRLSPYCDLDVAELLDEPVPDSPSLGDIDKVKAKEGLKLLKVIKPDEHVILLDINSREYNSLEFANFLNKKIDTFGNKLCFVIGGSYGFSDNVRDRANDFISLSKLTFTHQMTRLILLEQIYRGFKINNNEVYHK